MMIFTLCLIAAALFAVAVVAFLTWDALVNMRMIDLADEEDAPETQDDFTRSMAHWGYVPERNWKTGK